MSQIKQEVNDYAKILTGILVAIVAISVVVFGIRWYLTPASVALYSKTFHESQAYNDGVAHDIDDMRREYYATDATENSKNSIRAALTHELAGYDISRLSADQQSFVKELRGY